MIRATIDTNVTVSGSMFGGIPLDILHKAFTKKFTWVISAVLIDELKNVFSSKKFLLSKTEIESFLEPILQVAEVVVPAEVIDVISRCPKDNRVLECATAGICDYIVSGDRRDLVSMKTFRDIPIISPREFLKYI